YLEQPKTATHGRVSWESLKSLCRRQYLGSSRRFLRFLLEDEVRLVNHPNISAFPYRDRRVSVRLLRQVSLRLPLERLILLEVRVEALAQWFRQLLVYRRGKRSTAGLSHGQKATLSRLGFP